VANLDAAMPSLEAADQRHGVALLTDAPITERFESLFVSRREVSATL
jgi:hypothetical protein